MAKHISSLIKTNRKRLPAVFFSGVRKKRNPKLATPHRRHGRRRSIRSYWKDTWDAIAVRRKMERVLQPTERGSQDERVREKKERGAERIAKLSRLYEDKDFQYLWLILQRWEASSYEDIAKPEVRKDGMSLDYYIGYMAGRIGVLSDIKDLVIRATISQRKNAGQ